MQLIATPAQVADAFLDSISNELRTPLVSIQGALSYLQQEKQTDPTRRALIDNAAEEAMRLNRFIGNMLDMARVEAHTLRVELTPCDVADVIGSALERLSDQVNDRRVNVTIPPTLALVPLDFVLMVQVLVHLLDNALKYSAPNTPIDVRVRSLGSQLEISIADRGIGIPRHDLTRVFDKFYRVPRPSGDLGTGLGLAICKGIIQAHGGSIHANNRNGGGTLITVTLPLS
ncbi:MAG: hypothetical protein HZB51_25190 [Chloroflexi bacterium]|nr:hypothetical protein [Chloroflexota bacterium]